jgi:hypothetical protein
VSCGNNSYVWPDHYIVANVKAAHIVKIAVLINKDVLSNTNFVAASSVEWRYQGKAVIYALADELAEQGANFLPVIKDNRLSLAVMAMARLTFSTIKADSGVLL